MLAKLNPARLMRTLHRDEDGTSLTEFVICLPVFIIIFMGIWDLSYMSRDSVRVKTSAAKLTWQAAMEPARVTGFNQLMPNFQTTLPILAGAQALGKINSPRSTILPDLEATMANVQMMSKGSEGESRRYKSQASAPSNLDPWKHPKLTFAQRMTQDDRIRMLPRGSKGLELFNVAVPFSAFGTRHAMAAGTRYGMVQGKSSLSGSVSGGYSYNFGAAYDVLLSPVSRSGDIINTMVIHGFSRLTAEEDRCLKSVLSITPSIDYKC